MNAEKFLKRLSAKKSRLLGDVLVGSPLIGVLLGAVNPSARLDTVQQRFVIELLLTLNSCSEKTLERKMCALQIATYINTCK
jgi:hypothetical protein